MTSNHNLRFAKIPLNFGTGSIPALGFGTLIPALAETGSATTNALRVGFRHLDCAERYRNERAVGESLAAEFAYFAWFAVHLMRPAATFSPSDAEKELFSTRFGNSDVVCAGNEPVPLRRQANAAQKELI